VSQKTNRESQPTDQEEEEQQQQQQQLDAVSGGVRYPNEWEVNEGSRYSEIRGRDAARGFCTDHQRGEFADR